MGVNGIYGLSGSGLDVESMVKVGMMSKQSQYDKMQQKYTLNEWKKADMVELYGTMQTFNNSTLSQYKMSNNMDAHTAESSNSGIKVSASSSAPIMRHQVELGAAASNAYLIGTNSLTRLGDASSTSTLLKDVLFSDLQRDTAEYAKLNGEQVSKDKVAFSFSLGDGVNGGITSSNPAAATVAANPTSTSGSHEVEVTSMESNASATSTSITRVSGSSGSTSLRNIAFKSVTNNDDGTYTFVNSASVKNTTTIAASDLTTTDAFSFQIRDNASGTAKTISFTYDEVLNGGATLSTLADRINAAGLNITASYDAETDKFSMVNSKVGNDNTIEVRIAESFPSDMADTDTTVNKVSRNTARLLSNLNLSDGVTTASNVGTNAWKTFASGEYAKGTIDGTSVTFDGENSYTDSNGITYVAKGIGTSTVEVDAGAISKNTISVTYEQLLNGYTFNDLSSAVNALGQNARMTYDSVNDKFSLYNKESGHSNAIAISITEGDSADKTAEFFNNIGLKQSANGTLSENALTFTEGQATVALGSNASVKIDGVDYDLSENKTTVNGVTYDFTNATEGATATVSVTQDKDKIMDMVKSFVKDYNELLSKLYEAYDEKPNSNYKPLTDSQREGMKAEQIEKWEEKAKAGMLYHDRTLGKAIDDIRSAVTTKIDGISGKYNSIFALGISTTGIKGQLTLDEDKLKAALEDDSEAVYNVFAKLEYKTDATSASGKLQQAADNYSKSGIAQRLGDILNTEMKNFKSVSGSNNLITEDSELNTLLRDLQTKMSNFKQMMSAFETRLYKKYDAMETMLASLGTQLNYVTSSFS